MIGAKFPNTTVNQASYKFQKGVTEGEPYTFFFEQTYTNATISNAAITSFTVPIGRFLVIEEIIITSNNTTTSVALEAIIPTTGGTPDTTMNNIVGTRSLDTTMFLERQFTIAQAPFKVQGESVCRMYDKTTMNINSRDSGVTNFTGKLYITVRGTIYDLDMNWDADYVIIGIGDSIMSALNGGTDYYDDMIYLTRIRDYYALNKTISSTRYPGQNTRKVNRGKGGRNSTNGDNWRRIQYYYLPKIDMGVYNFMVNDAPTGSPITQPAIDTFISNLGSFITWFQGRYTGKPIIISSGTPITDNQHEANTEVLRQAAKSYIAGLSGTVTSLPTNTNTIRNVTTWGTIIFIYNGNAFDRTDVQFYNNAVGNGDGLHPNAVRGHAAIFNNCIKPALDAWLPKLI